MVPSVFAMKSIPFLMTPMIFQYFSIQHPSRSVPLAYRGVGDVPDSGVAIVVGTVQMTAMDDHGVMAVFVNVVSVVVSKFGDHDGPSAPMPMRVIGFIRCQGKPPHVGA